MSGMKQFNCTWPAPVKVVRGELPEKDMANLSKLPADERRRVFQAMKEHEPELNDLLRRLHDQFGRSEVHVDQDTAERLGVGGRHDPR